MATRRLGADEAALWARVMAGVRPLTPLPELPQRPRPDVKPRVSNIVATAVPPLAGIAVSPLPASRVRAQRAEMGNTPAGRNTLDGTWDRQLARGLVVPDRAIDLHGHSLASAHRLLDGALDGAVRSGERVLLLVTGKPPRPGGGDAHASAPVRGAIRAAVGDWLGRSRFAHDIAAIRPAHPRHGGAGALYIVLRKSRGSQKS